jgi:vitamin B12 transporter
LTTDINERLSIAGSMRIVRDTIDSDFSQPWPYPKVALEDYTLVNLNTAYQLNDGIKAIVQVENLLDEDYESALDFATPGRAFYVGVTSSF